MDLALMGPQAQGSLKRLEVAQLALTKRTPRQMSMTKSMTTKMRWIVMRAMKILSF